MITDRQVVATLLKIVKFQVVIRLAVTGNMAFMKRLDRGQVDQARLLSVKVPISHVNLWLIHLYPQLLGQPDNRPTSSRPSGDSSIGRPSDRDDYRRPTQSGDGGRPNIQSMSEINYKEFTFLNQFMISVDGRHPSDIYRPAGNNRPIGGPDNSNVGGDSGRQPGGYDAVPGDNNGSQQRQPTYQGKTSGGGPSSLSPNAGPSQVNRSGGQPDARLPIRTGTDNAVATYPGAPDATTSDVYNAIRNAFKLPPGLCLVRCDTLRSDQQSLTPQQVHDAFTLAGIPSGSQDTSQPSTGRLSPNQLTQYPVGSQTHELPSGSQLGTLQPGGSGQISNVGDQHLVQNRPAGGTPSQIGQHGGDTGGYRYQTPQDRFPGEITSE